MASGAQTFVTAIVGTGADLTVSKIGFCPRKIEIINRTDPGFAFWVEGMPDDSMAKQVDGTSSFVTSDGITPTDDGFELGADTDINVDGEQLFVTCWK
jgi:hypothetical protein